MVLQARIAEISERQAMLKVRSVSGSALDDMLNVQIGLYLDIAALKEGTYDQSTHAQVRASLILAVMLDAVYFNGVHKTELGRFTESCKFEYLTVEQLQWFTCVHETQLSLISYDQCKTVVEMLLNSQS